MRINHNVAALNTHRQLTMNNSNAAKNLEKLSSGLRINRAGDDAAGLAISEKMRGQIRGLDMAAKNALDGISLIQTAEGALNETHAILQRMRELAVQAASDTNTPEDRMHMDAEIVQLNEEIDRIAATTEFNGQKLLDGSFGAGAAGGNPFILHIGANAGQSISLAIRNMDSGEIGTQVVNVATQTAADTAITTIDAALNVVSEQRGLLGAVHNRLEHTINNLGTASENLTEAESRIRDVDMAKEMMDFTKNSILTQAAQAMLAQANQLPQGVLQLLR